MLALLAACGGGGGGGGGDGPGATDPPAPVLPPTVAFKLVPARLGLAVGGDGALLILSPPGALTWSSSNPAVASVDATGRVSALAPGSAVISVTSGAQTTTAPVKVHGSTDATAGALIATALAQNRITAEQALMYRVLARFGDPRLPAEFDGAPQTSPEHLLMREVSGKLATLSEATQAVLMPFLLPPAYAESWYAQQPGAPASGAAAGSAAAVRARALAAPGGVRRQNLITVNCRVTGYPTGWLRRSTAHFNIYYPDVQPSNQAEANISQAIATVVEEVYLSMTSLLQRFPISDLGEACNGGDGAADIYLNFDMPAADYAATTTYPGRCEAVASYVSINSMHPFFRYDVAQRPSDAAVLRKVKAVLAHEITHVLQFAMDRHAACDDYVWADEATAQWAMDYVDPTYNQEDGFEKLSSAGTRTGGFLLRYLADDHMRSIERPGPDETVAQHGYAEYLFFQYLVRKYAPATIKQIFDAQVAQASVEAVESVLAARGGMKAVWPEFAQSLWVGAAGPGLEYWNNQDRYDYGLANIFEPATGDAFAAGRTRLKTLEVDQRSQPRATFKLLENALEFPGDFYAIEARSLYYEHLKFSDATVHSVILMNPIAVLPNREFMKLQAVKKIGGVWRPVEDWTADSSKSFCLDKVDERLEELILIVSNSEVSRGAEQPFRIPKIFPMRLSTSNVGCWKWKGAASTEKTYDDGIISGVATGSGVVEFEVLNTLAGRLQFEPRSGFIDGIAEERIGLCQSRQVGARRNVSTGVPPDGTLDLNLDLDLGFGETPNRELITLTGFGSLLTTATASCPRVPDITTVGDQSWTWLQLDSEATYTVSADGQTIEGSYIASFPLTRSSIKTLFRFTAVRE